ncbi:MAG: pyruvate ferredoxin oxidoreductase [Eubacterium sp.]|nr:pyruvate ferredoxin oxidoreductase [Eubacterium sp.]
MVKSILERMSGNEAVAHAIKQVEPDVMPAFPITPSTELPQFVSNFIANGEIDTEFIPVESEHSSMSAAIGASAAGARALTATSSCGLALMWEVLYVAASNRLPLCMAVVNRALSGPLNINSEHSDSMGARDSGWIQIYAENNQEAYDNFIQAYRISEHKDVMLPIMICQDGFITSHAVENITLMETEDVKKFVGTYEPEHFLLNPEEPMAVGPYAVSNYCMEAKRAQAQAMMNAKQVILDVADEFRELTGRGFGLFEEYYLDDAEYAIVAIGSACGTIKDAVDKMRSEGKKVGLLKVRVFRPFPGKEMAEALKDCKVVGIFDRCESYSANGGPLGAELMAAMYRNKNQAETVNYIYGLSGRDLTVEQVEETFDELMQTAEEGTAGNAYRYIGLRDKMED